MSNASLVDPFCKNESLWRHGGLPSLPRPHGSQTSRSQHREHPAPVSSLGASKSPDLGSTGTSMTPEAKLKELRELNSRSFQKREMKFEKSKLSFSDWQHGNILQQLSFRRFQVKSPYYSSGLAMGQFSW